MSTYVFLGPTLSVTEARAVLSATFLPPAALGDVCDLVLDRTPPDAVVIVDGAFDQAPAVSHNEILFALSRGVAVFGAASMGALRAAELAPFGMVGVGRIFELFLDGEEDDDEVAVAHADAENGYRPLSDAMVDVRYALQAALARGLLSVDDVTILTSVAKDLHYADRAWTLIARHGQESGVAQDSIARLLRFVRDERPSVKREDALAVLRVVEAFVPSGDRSAAPSFQPTVHWRELCAEVLARRATSNRAHTDDG